MFYLKHFFQTIKNNAFSGVIFLAFTIILGTIPGVRKQIDNEIKSKFLTVNKDGDYFHALIPSKYNHQSISRKMSQLPGVEKVELLSEELVNSEANKVLNDIPAEIVSEIEIKYVGLKVNYLKEITPRSQELIRSYMKRLVGEDLIIGEIFHLEQEQGSVDKIKEWGSSVLYGIVLFLWIIAFIFFNRKLVQASYIVERFQRRQLVALKTMLSGTSLVMFAVISALVFVKNTALYMPIISIGIIFGITFLACRKVSWS